MTEEQEIDPYAQALEEVETEQYDKPVWARAIAEAEGDDKKTKALYIKMRAGGLQNDDKNKKEIKRKALTEKARAAEISAKIKIQCNDPEWQFHIGTSSWESGDQVRGYKWLKLAAKQGNKDARDYLLFVSPQKLIVSQAREISEETLIAEQVELSSNQTEAVAKNPDKEATPEVVTSENEHKPTNVWVKIVVSIIAVIVVALLSAAITEIILGRRAAGASNLVGIMELSVLVGIWHKTTATAYKRFVGIVVGIIGGTFLWYLMQVFMFSEMGPLPYFFMASSFAVALYAPKYVCQR